MSAGALAAGSARGWTARSPRHGGRLVAACVLLILAAEVAALVLTRADAFRPGLAALLAAGLPYAAAIWLVLRGGVRIGLPTIVLVALALRLVVLPFDPTHSTDVFRYVWEGRVQAAGFSPYLHVPADPVLIPLRDAAIWPHVNRADYAPTIYPPLAQAFFLLVTRVSETVLAMKLAFVLCEGVTLWALVRLLDLGRQPQEWAIVYAWSPLAVWEFAGGGHVDALMIACTMGALLAARTGRAGLAGAALAGAVMVKFFPLVLAPALWRRFDPRLPLAMAGTLALGYLAYAWEAGVRVVGFAPTYASEEGIRDGSGFWLLRLAHLAGLDLSSRAYLTLAAALLLALGAVAALNADRSLPRPRPGFALALAAGATLAVSPQYPWYFAWLLPLLALNAGGAAFWPLLWLALSGFLLYWDYSRAVPWIADTVYGGALVLLGVAALVHALPYLAARFTGRPA